MALRVLALVMFLGLHSGMGALTGLLHLCGGSVQLRATCCCGHGQKKAPTPVPQELATAKEVRCCDAPVVRPASERALASFESRWELAPPAIPPAPPVLALPPEPESLPAAWVRTEAIRRSTAPPLYLQNRAFLI